MRRALSLCLALGLGCSDGEPDCPGLTIASNPTALNFGDLYARSADERGDPDDPTRTPHHRVVILENGCGGVLEITEVCIANDRHNGVDDDPAFLLEPPLHTELGPGGFTGARVTYDHTVVNEDIDRDAERDPDIAALIVHSNAQNAPTLVVPLCGRIIRDDETAESFDCPAPFTVPAGQRLATACNL